MSNSTNKLVQCWGINDIDYPVVRKDKIGGKWKIVWVCPYYKKWRGMLERCFSSKFQEKQPTYKDCTVCEDWKYLSNFIKWVDSQPNRDWVNCELDKDLLIIGNKHYSPDTCVFVDRVVNMFLTNRGNARGDHMLGVSYMPNNIKKNPYQSRCRDPFRRKASCYIGYYNTELEAHLAWQAKKHEYACQLADMQEDERVAKALRERYAPDKDWG